MRTNENNFIHRLKRKKEDALDFVVDRYLPLIKGVTYNVLAPLQDEGLIDECVNDVLLSIWNNADKFHGESADFRKWVCAVAKYKSIDFYRRSCRKTNLSTADFEDAAGYERSAEEELILLENQKELIDLIHTLEPVDRTIFTMKYFLGSKTEEISSKLGLSNASVDNRLYRGKKRLYINAKKQELRGDI